MDNLSTRLDARRNDVNILTFFCYYSSRKNKIKRIGKNCHSKKIETLNVFKASGENMDRTVNDCYLNRFTIKWRSEIGQYAGYPSLTNSTPAGTNGLYIGGGEHYFIILLLSIPRL